MTRALVLVVVAVVVAVLVLRHTGSSSPARPASASKSTTTTSTVKSPPTTTRSPFIPPGRTTVQVLNGLLSGSLAGNLSTRLEADGFKTLPPNDTTAATKTSVVYLANPGYYREAVSLAIRLGLTRAAVQRTIPSAAPIPTGVAAHTDLIVVIGTSLDTLASSA